MATHGIGQSDSMEDFLGYISDLLLSRLRLDIGEQKKLKVF
jgi:hypothetical protein